MSNEFTEEDVKATICGIIDEIWDKNMPNNSVENISPEVMQIMDDVFQGIRRCSKTMVFTDVTLNYLMTAPGRLADIIVSLAAQVSADTYKERNPLATFINWIQAIRGNRSYKMCINTAAVNYRSRVQLALMSMYLLRKEQEKEHGRLDSSAD